MQLSNSNYRIIKPAPKYTTLDYNSISGTTTYDKNERKHKLTRAERIKLRFPDDIWYGNEFIDWAMKYDNARFRSINLDYEGNIKIDSGKLLLRWSDLRKWKNKQIIKAWSEQELEREGYYMVTLTVKHGMFGFYTDMVNTVNMLRECWNGVRRFINRKGWKYLRVMEPGEINHYPHYHMVICNVDNPKDIEQLVNLWLRTAHKLGNNASPKAQNVRYTENVRYVSAYVSKYLSKTLYFNVNDKYFWRWIELSYRNGIRVFAMDKNSSKFVKWYFLKAPSGTAGDTEIYYDEDV